MIINEGIKVRIMGDNQSLLRALKGGGVAAMAFKGTVGAALVGVAAQSTRMAAQLDRDIRLIATLGGEAAQSMGRVRNEIKQLGNEFGRNFNQLATANYQAVSSGFTSIADSMALTRAGTKLAIAGNGELADSTKLVASVLNAFGEDASRAEDAAAGLFSIIRAGQIDAAQMGTLLQDLPAAASGVGVSMDEMGAALSVLTVQTGSVSKAVDQLRSLFVKLAVEGIQGSSLQEKLDKLAGMGLPELTKALGDQNAALAASIFVQRPDLLPNALAGFTGQVGKLDEAVDTMTSGPMAAWDKLLSNVKSGMEDLGMAVLTFAKPAIDELNRVLGESKEKLDSLVDHELVTNPDGSMYWRSRIATGPQGRQGERPDMLTDFSNRARAQGGPDPFGSFDSPNPLVAPPDITRPVPVAIAEVSPGVLIGGDPNLADGQRFLFETPGFQDIDNPFAQMGSAAPNYFNGIPFALPDQPFGPQPRNPFADDPDTEFIGGELKDFDFSELDSEFSNIQQSSNIAAASAGILSGAIGGMLTSAFVTADNAAGRFVQGLIASFAQLGVRTLIGSAFGIPGFASGGFTGGGGMVHANEYVFNSDAVNAIGLGRLERMHATGAAGGSTYNVGGITVNAPSNDAAAIASVTADAVGAKLRELDTTNRRALYRPAPQKYGR